MKNKGREPTRRSSRKRTNEETSPAVHGKKRKSALSEEAGTAEKQQVQLSPKIQKAELINKIQKTVRGRKVDGYCWICHKRGQEVICTRCPRVYHQNCISKSHVKFNNLGRCEECEGQSLIKGVKSREIERRRMRQVLKFALEAATKEDVKKNSLKTLAPVENPKFCRYFKSWALVDIDSFGQIMDLDILIDKVNDDFVYKTCAEFLSDVKWINHNCHILYGPESEITELALKLEKNFKKELLDIDGCPECYCTKHLGESQKRDFFTDICEVPHEVIWAKLRGSPYWPAKCLRVYNDHADVRFFGTHDKSVIPFSSCYRISRISPNPKKIKQSKYMDAMMELSTYVSNCLELHEGFKYYEPYTALNSNDSPKTPAKRGRRRKIISQHKITGGSHISENDADAEETSKALKKSVPTKLEDRVAVCMDFMADDESCPLNESRLLDTSPISVARRFPRVNIPNCADAALVHNRALLLDGTCKQTETVPFINSNTSNELPVITSAKSQGSPTRNSCYFPAETDTEQVNNDTFQNIASRFAEINTESIIQNSDMSNPDEIVCIGEKTVETQLAPEILCQLAEVLKDSQPEIRDLLKKNMAFVLNIFIELWSAARIRKHEDTFLQMMLSYSNMTHNRIAALKNEREKYKYECELLKETNYKLRQQVSDAASKWTVAINRQENAKKVIQMLRNKAAVKGDVDLEEDGFLEGHQESKLQELMNSLANKEKYLAQLTQEINKLRSQHETDQATICDLRKQCKMYNEGVSKTQKMVGVQTDEEYFPDDDMPNQKITVRHSFEKETMYAYVDADEFQRMLSRNVINTTVGSMENDRKGIDKPMYTEDGQVILIKYEKRQKLSKSVQEIPNEFLIEKPEDVTYSPAGPSGVTPRNTPRTHLSPKVKKKTKTSFRKKL